MVEYSSSVSFLLLSSIAPYFLTSNLILHFATQAALTRPNLNAGNIEDSVCMMPDDCSHNQFPKVSSWLSNHETNYVDHVDPNVRRLWSYVPVCTSRTRRSNKLDGVFHKISLLERVSSWDLDAQPKLLCWKILGTVWTQQRRLQALTMYIEWPTLLMF